jgi:hypothetical protein
LGRVRVHPRGWFRTWRRVRYAACSKSAIGPCR